MNNIIKTVVENVSDRLQFFTLRLVSKSFKRQVDSFCISKLKKWYPNGYGEVFEKAALYIIILSDKFNHYLTCPDKLIMLDDNRLTKYNEYYSARVWRDKFHIMTDNYVVTYHKDTLQISRVIDHVSYFRYMTSKSKFSGMSFNLSHLPCHRSWFFNFNLLCPIFTGYGTITFSEGSTWTGSWLDGTPSDHLISDEILYCVQNRRCTKEAVSLAEFVYVSSYGEMIVYCRSCCPRTLMRYDNKFWIAKGTIKCGDIL